MTPREFRKQWMAAGGSVESVRRALEDLLDPEQRKFVGPEPWRDEEFRRWSRMGPQGFGISLFKGDKRTVGERKGWMVMREKHITMTSGKMGVPDLVSRLAGRAVVEISFPYREQVCDLCEDMLETAGRGRHGMACHAAKCMNTRKTPEEGIRCFMCGRGFGSKRGLSLHMRAAHIEEYVAQGDVRREEQQEQQEEGKKGKWSEEEVAALRGLMGEGEERRGILAEACALIPGRTKEQVRGKIRYKGRQVRAQAGPSQEEVIREMKRHLMVERNVPGNAGQGVVRQRIRRALRRLRGSGTEESTLTPDETEANLRGADLEIRRAVKRWLHLDPGTSNGLLYSKRADGGLAIPCLAKAVALAIVKRISSLYHA
ncbi:unnamed protein product [Arctogadus glacialis]